MGQDFECACRLSDASSVGVAGCMDERSSCLTARTRRGLWGDVSTAYTSYPDTVRQPVEVTLFGFLKQRFYFQPKTGLVRQG